MLAASLLLPGLAVLATARAEEPPEQGVVALKYGSYRDWQPGWQRIRVGSPQLYLLAPVAGQWSVEGTHVIDSVSGATPRMHSSRTGATPFMSDRRRATDVKVTRYFHRAAIAAGAAYSAENDYWSHAQSIEARLSSEDNNRTWSFGFGRAQDRIDTTATGGAAADRHKRTHEFMAGVTQVLTPDDAAQLLYTRSQGRGYFDDPYKDFDRRPAKRDADILLARWNHHVERFDGTLRASWRYYRDTFGIRAHTLAAEWVQPAGAWTVTPGLRWYTQSAASFYFDPVADVQGRASDLLTRRFFLRLAGEHSADQRLAAFGAVTLSLKLAYAFSGASSVDLKIEHYRQAAHLKPGGGSPLLEPFRARFVQVGWSHKF